MNNPDDKMDIKEEEFDINEDVVESHEKHETEEKVEKPEGEEKVEKSEKE